MKREHYRHAVGTCERCHSRIEPLISLQWWCRMEEPASPAIEALARAARALPPRVAAPLRDRVARGGARLVPLAPALVGAPASDLDTPGRARRSARRPRRRRRRVPARASRSSAIPTSSTRGSRRRSGRSRRSGGPIRRRELERYYPGNVNSTAREIIRLWENRMIWTGLEVIGEVPFTDVIIHSTVLAADGRRMSKSLGTGVDPMEPIEAHGADATRYGLLKISSTQDVRYSVGAIEEGRKLANKLWNVARLILQQAEGVDARRRARPRSRSGGSSPGSTRRAPRSRRPGGASTSRRRPGSSTTSPSTTSATGTRRRSSRGSTTATPTAARRRCARSSCCSRSSTR